MWEQTIIMHLEKQNTQNRFCFIILVSFLLLFISDSLSALCKLCSLCVNLHNYRNLSMWWMHFVMVYFSLIKMIFKVPFNLNPSVILIFSPATFPLMERGVTGIAEARVKELKAGVLCARKHSTFISNLIQNGSHWRNVLGCGIEIIPHPICSTAQ